MTESFPRSFLFVPANRLRLVESAFRSAADALVFDLEDSVPPADKAAARHNLAARLSGRDRPWLCVRVNAPGTLEHDADCRTCRELPLRALVVPKVQDAGTARQLAAGTGRRRLILLLETPAGVLRALDIAEAAGDALLALGLGAEDLRASCGIEAAAMAPLLAFARPRIALAAAACGVPAIDTPELDPADEAALRAGAARARGLGFQAGFAIHPSQLAVIHEAFRTTADERAWAARVERAYAEAVAEGRGSAIVDGRMIDAATLRRARQILHRSGPR